MSGCLRVATFCVVATVTLCAQIPCFAIILHPDGEPSADFSDIDIPDPNIIGRWGSNASCVAIGRNLVITTVHQENIYTPHPEILRPVQIGAVTYTPDAVWTTAANTDIRIVKLQHANLNAFVAPYLDTNETGQEIVIGGYGKPRGSTLSTEGTPYGYTWANTQNTILRFCTNRIDSIYTLDDPNYIVADFDDLPQYMTQAEKASHEPTTFEGTVAQFDSGCGCLIKDGTWKLAGLIWGVQTHEPVADQIEAWFRDPDTLNLSPDELYAWRISDYQSWIDGVITSQPNCPYIETDLNDDCVIDESDLLIFAGQWLTTDCGPANNYCQGADFDGINGVDMADFAVLAADWLNDYRP